MAGNGVNAIGLLCIAAAGLGLGVASSDPAWSPPRTDWGSLQAKVEAAAAAREAPKATAPAPAPAEAPAAAGAAHAPPEPAKGAAPKGGVPPEGGDGKGAAPAPPSKKGPPAPEPAKPAFPSPGEIEFRVSGLAVHRGSLPLTTPAAERLDVYVTASGAMRVNADFASPDAASAAIKGADPKLRSGGLLYVIPNSRTPWEATRDLLGIGAEAGWTRVALAVAVDGNPGQGRVLPVAIPAKDVADIAKGVDPIKVKVAAGPEPVFELNGEACKGAAALEKKAKSLHDDCELMAEGYALDVEKTPWTVDGTGAMTGNVVAALDAIAGAGVKAVRIEGLKKTAAEPAPAEDKK